VNKYIACLFLCPIADDPGKVEKITASARDYLILTNNPLVMACLKDRYQFDYRPDATYREILILARDMVYMGHTLYTHPLSGSVKPNETPYKSVVVSKVPHKFEADQAEIIANAVVAFDKFKPLNRVLTEKILQDFQLVDYTLLCGGIGFDAIAGLSAIK